MAWARGHLRNNFRSEYFHSFHKIWKTLKIQENLLLNCPRVLAITFLSHNGLNVVQILRSCGRVNRFARCH